MRITHHLLLIISKKYREREKERRRFQALMEFRNMIIDMRHREYEEGTGIFRKDKEGGV